MSFGGATAVEACHREPRCGAAVNLDGGHWFLLDSDLLDGDVRMPMLMVHASDPGTLPNPSDANPTDYRAYSDSSTRSRRRGARATTWSASGSMAPPTPA